MLAILEQEKTANESLTELAVSRSNREALGDTEQTGSESGAADERPANLRRGIRPVAAPRNRTGSMAR